MLPPMLERLTEVKIRKFEDLVGETIVNHDEYDVLYLVTASGRWCKLTGDIEEEYGATVLISEHPVEFDDVRILAELGIVAAQEMEEWERYLAARNDEAQKNQRRYAIERMCQLITTYPDEARTFLDEGASA